MITFRRISILLVFSMSLLFFSCGIPSDAYLYPPDAETSFSMTPQLMMFRNSTENSSSDIEFVGFLLFYKFYAGPTGYTTDDYQDYGETYLTSSVINNYFDIENGQGLYSSQRLSLFKVIEVNNTYENENFLVTLNFQDASLGSTIKGAIGYSGGDVEIPHLYRSFQRSGEWKTGTYYFSTLDADYISGDTDLPSGYTDGSYLMTCAVWVVGYGYNLKDSIQNIYSEPVYIGNFTINIS